MNSKLHRFYLLIRPVLLIIAFYSYIAVVFNLYSEYKSRQALIPWYVVEVTTGNSFKVSRGKKYKKIELCGVGSLDKEYLRFLINKGDGSVYLQESGYGHEAWVGLKPDRETEIHLNTEMISSGKANLYKHHECLSAENLVMADRYLKN